MPGMLSRNLKSAVKNVVGTCVSLGIIIENKPAKEIEQEIDAGKYDKEINEEITETPAEKKAELASYFADIQSEQEKTKKAEEAAAEAAKEAEAEAAEAEEKPAEEGEKKEEAKPEPTKK
jgi:hypothetical protein